MSSFAADLGIWVLLFCGIVFCGIGVLGLLIFPDTRSRMFTAFRASGIGIGAVIAAVLVYAASLSLGTGDSTYTALAYHLLFLAAVLAAGLLVMHRIIRDRIGREPAAGSPPGATEHQ